MATFKDPTINAMVDAVDATKSTASVQCPKCGYLINLAVIGERLAKLEQLALIVKELDGVATMPFPLAIQLGQAMQALKLK